MVSFCLEHYYLSHFCCVLFQSLHNYMFDIQENSVPEEKVIVAIKQGNLLGTAFHPELTADTRWHSYFLKMASETGEGTSSRSVVPAGGVDLSYDGKPRIDLPIFQ
uniref:Glutamine amidotransferase domain-containing protein n=1 Tax=Salix viminalis TaxID=40686 RepID=A0A6N2LGJ1_SALVM